MPGREKRAVFVLGMHRSGTSAMARVLGLSGCALPRRLMPPNSANPSGYWEPEDAADLDDAILADLDSSWSDVFGPRHHRSRRLFTADHLARARAVLSDSYPGEELIVFKEPRATLLIDLWRTAAEEEGFEPHFVLMVRHPLAVAQSLAAREGVGRNRALLLWATYMLAAETATRRDKRAFVGFDELIDGPEAVLDKLETSFGFAFPQRTWSAANDIDGFLETELIHHRPTGHVGGDRFQPLDDLYAYLLGAARGEKENADVPADVAAWLDGLEETVGPVLNLAEGRAGAVETEALRQEAAALRAELERTGASAAEGEVRLAAATARTATLAAVHEQRRAQLLAERDDAMRKAAELQRSLTAQLEDARDQLARAQERTIGLETEVAGLARRLADSERDLQAHRLAMGAELARLAQSAEQADAEAATLAERLDGLQERHAEAQRASRNAKRRWQRELTRAGAARDERARSDAERIAGLQADVADVQFLAGQRIAALSEQLALANGRPIGSLQALVFKRAARIVSRRLGLRRR